MEMGAGTFHTATFLARGGTRAVERRLRSAVAPAHRRPLRQQSVSPAALLSISGLHQALAGQFSRTVLGLTARLGLRSADPRHSLRRGQLGVAHLGSLGTGLGGVAERHGGLAVHLLPTSRRPGLPAGDGRNHLRTGTPRGCTCRARKAFSTSFGPTALSAASPTAMCSIRTKWSNPRTTSKRPTRRCCSRNSIP
jgi:hypothetical protein